MKKVVIKKEKVSVVQSGHPWIFSGAICHIDPIEKGELVHIVDTSGTFLAMGYANKDQSLTCRILSYEKQEIEDLLKTRFKEAYDLRQKTGLLQLTNAYRLINAEGDRLGGLIIDIYDKTAVMQVSTWGMERLKKQIASLLVSQFNLENVIERSDSASRTLEGLEKIHQVLVGNMPDRIEIFEEGIKLSVDVKEGQKTGYFLDQRPMRVALKDFAKDRSVLNVFSYTGGFSLHALSAGAKKVTSVDVDKKALSLLDQIALASHWHNHQSICVDAFEFLESQELSEYDLIILDPPAFAKKQKDIPNASKGYKRLMSLTLKKMKPGSILYVASCSYFMDESLFEKLLLQAAAQEKRCLKLIMNQKLAVDHPRLLAHKEGTYLKGFVVQVF